MKECSRINYIKQEDSLISNNKHLEESNNKLNEERYLLFRLKIYLISKD